MSAASRLPDSLASSGIAWTIKEQETKDTSIGAFRGRIDARIDMSPKQRGSLAPVCPWHSLIFLFVPILVVVVKC